MLASFTSETLMLMAGTGALGVLVAWLLLNAANRRSIARNNDRWQTAVDDLSRKRDSLLSEADKYRNTIESQQGALHRHEQAVSRANTALVSSKEKINALSKDIFTLRAEREDSKGKLLAFQNALNSVQHQSQELQQEFLKSRDFYKSELKKAFEKRKAIETKLDNAGAEQESLNTLLKGTRSEHDSVNRMLQSAQNRLGEIDKLEEDVIRLEADNAQLKHDTTLAQQETERLQRDVLELEELKVQNTELRRRIESMEESRRQYENDAKRYQDVAGESEKQSETLRVRLDEVEQNFLELEKQQRKAIKQARKEARNANKPNGHAEEEVVKEVDDLKEIVGIGKVFEGALNELGVYTFKQIASFGMSDIARVNSKLKEFKGRMEQDDWIGQAKELHYKKHSSDTA